MGKPYGHGQEVVFWSSAVAYYAWLAGRSREESRPLGQEPGWSSAGGKVAWGRMGKVMGQKH